MTISKTKLANKKFRHEQRRKQKAYHEKIRGLEKRRHQKRLRDQEAARRAPEIDYINQISDGLL